MSDVTGHDSEVEARAPVPDLAENLMMNALPHPVLLLDRHNYIQSANTAAEFFFHASRTILCRNNLSDFLPFASPVLALTGQVFERSAPINEYRIDIGTPRNGDHRVVDVYAAPVPEAPGHIVLVLQERTMTDKIERQLSYRGAARTVTGLAAMLAHEIKNPLSGIRGAAQLLESVVEADDKALTQLITDEADRIVKLVDRMEVFSDERPIDREPVNIHVVLDHVKRLAQSGFGQSIRFVEDYDPSLPDVYGNRDQLIQIFLNLVKNACESLSDTPDPEIVLATGFKPGIRLTVPGAENSVNLPLEISVRDNGPGVPEDIKVDLFDPFVTSKVNGTGLGLALVAKIVGTHGGVIECDSAPRRTNFRVMLPKFNNKVVPQGDKGAGA
ncbi:two-component system sensor histidine kinase NtrB [Coralliovum pocilloporae]|uniref:two-component system sensor histidine kinase NtrB n=1 Tax=Coralliovum pocilloporae TaxID=3066369 RepID=UPI003307C351